MGSDAGAVGGTPRRGRVGAGATLLAAAALAALPRPASAQTVAGTVHEGDGGPVVGALVRLVGADGRPGPTYLTAADGRYSLTASGPGVHHLVVERIGLSTVRAGPVAVPASGTVSFDLRVDAEPVRLEGLTVEAAHRLCRDDEASGARLQALWDEVRKALTAARWTEREEALLLRVRRHLRRRAPGDLAVIEEAADERTGRGPNSVYGLPADELDRTGYVRTAADGGVEYFGPDAETLLSDAFLDRHCFHLVPERDDGAAVTGLGFRPLPGRDLPDVEGVLWVDRASRRLDRLDFRYTGLPPGPGADLATGRVEFTELADGRWIVTRWYLRMPVLGVVRSSAARRGTVERRMVTEVVERGATVLSARGEGYAWSPDSPEYRVEGVVRDSVAGGALEGAEVRLAGRGWVTRTGADGRFSLGDVPPGRYRITFHHPRLDSLGLRPAWRTVVVPAPGAEGGAGPTSVDLAIPSRATLSAARCGEGATPLVGRVVDPATGRGVPGARVEARGAGGGVARAGADAEGWYAVCDPPAERPVRVVARLGPLSGAPAEAPPAEGGATRVDLVLPLDQGRVKVGAEEDGAPGALSGTVTDAVDERLLEGALVELVDPEDRVVDRALADARGRFTLRVPAPGDYRLRAELLGYRDLSGAPMRLGGDRRVEVRMAPEAVEVEGLVVRVEARVAALEQVGFYRRRLFLQGAFLPREVLEETVPTRTSDLLLRHTSARRFDMASLTGNTTSRWFQFRSANRTGRSGCLPAVYLDGTLARKGWMSGMSGGPGEGYPTLDDLVSPEEIEALEIYETQLPARFSGGGGCGAIVVWRTRGPGG